jgi:hypothetical protein
LSRSTDCDWRSQSDDNREYGNSIYEDFDNHLCRTKIAVKTDVPFKNALGGHQVVFYGDHRAKIKGVAGLIGFDVVEGK